MTTENFCYWLQGLMEIQNPETLNATQVQEIKNHLNLVFTKVTPQVTIHRQLKPLSIGNSEGLDCQASALTIEPDLSLIYC